VLDESQEGGGGNDDDREKEKWKERNGLTLYYHLY